MSKANLPTDVAQFAGKILGPPREVREIGSATGTARTFLWVGQSALGYLKTYRSVRPYRQEHDAYRRWTLHLQGVPTLLGATPTPTPALAISALAGRPVADVDLDPAVERALHETAGAWLRRLHEVPAVDDDPVDLADAYRMRWSHTREVDPGEGGWPVVQRWVGETLAGALPVIGGSRVPCHRDYQPGNWLVDTAGRWVGVIDFEHARLDHPLSDVARVAAYVWPERPDLEHAFRNGYGRLPGNAAMLRAFAVAEAWHRWLWAHRHDDRQLARGAADALAAHGAPVDPDDLAYPAP